MVLVCLKLLVGGRKCQESLSWSGNQGCNLPKVARERKMEAFFSFFNIKGKGMEKGGRGEETPASGDRSGREGERGKEGETERQAEKVQGEIKKETGGRQGPPTKMEHGECTQKVLLVAAVEDGSYQAPRAGQCTCLNTNIYHTGLPV